MYIYDEEMVQEISQRFILHWNYRGFTSLPPELEQFGHHVSELYLKHNLLSTLPTWIGCLTNLTNIYLQANNLTHLPEPVCLLVNLEVLDLSQNGLETLPELIGQLTNLTKLVLAQNKLHTLPESLGSLHNLTSLQLSSNQICHVPSSLRKCHALYELCLDRNYLESLPRFLSRLPNLQLLSVCGNKLKYLPCVPFANIKRFLFDDNSHVTHIPYTLACQLSETKTTTNIPVGVFTFSAYGCFSSHHQKEHNPRLTQLQATDNNRHLFKFPQFSVCRGVAKLSELALRSCTKSFLRGRVACCCDNSRHMHQFSVNGIELYDGLVNQLKHLIPNNLFRLLNEGPLGFCIHPACGQPFFTAAWPVIVPKSIIRRRDNSSVSLQEVFCALLFCSTRCFRDFYLRPDLQCWERHLLDSCISFNDLTEY